jgi:hypothetical protein
MADVNSLTFNVDPAQPDVAALIDLGATVETVNKPADVELQRLTAFVLPRNDDAGIDFDGNLMNPQGAGDPVLRLEADDTITVRVTNTTLTNGSVADWCQRPVEVEIEFTGGGRSALGSKEVTVLCN